MPNTRLVILLAACGFGLAACEPAQQSGPLPYFQGTVQEQLRQQQLRNATSGANPGVQNPLPMAVNPGTTGIVRDGTGSVAAGSPSAVNPGTTGILRPGVGAPTR